MSIYRAQYQMHYGFEDLNGNKWCDGWVNSYNNYTDAINQYTDKEIVTDSLCDKSLQFALDQRHRFVTWCNDYLESSK